MINSETLLAFGFAIHLAIVLYRETLTTAAQLRLGPSVSFGEVEKVVTSLIEKLGLTKAANTVVGNAKVRGLSGGERKRLSIACELLGDPSLLFCDEPTTGLDSFQAEQVGNLSFITLVYCSERHYPIIIGNFGWAGKLCLTLSKIIWLNVVFLTKTL